jgi:hypothetical protein
MSFVLTKPVLPYQWALVSYHKSGHMLSFQLSEAMTRLNLKKYNINHMPHESSSIYNDFPETEGAHVLHLAQPHFLLNWTQLFDMSETVKPRIIHFCRAPTELVMSGFLYHAQSPTPESTNSIL